MGETKSTSRFLWELWHKLSGRLALLFALINITLGLSLAVASEPLRIIWYVYLGFVISLYIVFEMKLSSEKCNQKNCSSSSEFDDIGKGLD